MPGTFASVFATIISYFMLNVYGQNCNIISFFAILLLGQFSIVVLLKKIHKKDPAYIVIDELLGIYITFIVFFYFCDQICHFKYSNSYKYYYITGFILFRIFDICKPFPISVIDKESKFGSYQKQALFIIMDDIVAGIFSALCGALIFSFPY